MTEWRWKWMKKNILTVIILALALINVILTALIVFVVVPTSNKTNKLITQVASVINLELEGEKAEGQINVEDIDTSFKIEKSLTMNLKKSDDGSEHFAMMDSISFSMDMTNKDYAKYKETLVGKEDIFTTMVSDVLVQYNKEQVYGNQDAIKEEVLKRIKEYYNSNFIIDISFGNFRFQ